MKQLIFTALAFVILGCSSQPPADAAEDDGVFTLVMLGDSLTHGFNLPKEQALPTRLEEALADDPRAIRVINAGVSGDTTAQGLARFDADVVAEADGVLVELGGNDMLMGLAPARARANIAEIVRKSEERGLWVGLVGIHSLGMHGPAYESAFNAIYPGLEAEFDIPLYANYFDGIMTPDTKEPLPEYVQTDGIHPTAAGMKVVANRMAPWLKEVLPAEAADIHN